jgi:hypothetical protein
VVALKWCKRELVRYEGPVLWAIAWGIDIMCCDGEIGVTGAGCPGIKRERDLTRRTLVACSHKRVHKKKDKTYLKFVLYPILNGFRPL